MDKFGFLQRPISKGSAYKKWVNIASHAKKTLKPNITSTSYRNDLHQTPNWAGFENYKDDSNQTNLFSEVQGEYYQPTEKTDSLSGSVECSWVGIGGDNAYYSDKKLIQCGTCMNNYKYFGWFEWLGPNNAGVNMIGEDAVTVNSGDQIEEDVRYDTANQQGFFFVEDATNGTYFDGYASLPASTYYSGLTAE